MTAVTLDLDELTVLFGYKNRRALVRAIKNDKFPVPTYEISPNNLVADAQVVNEYFERKRQAGLTELGEKGPVVAI